MPRTFVWHPGKGPRKTAKQNLPESGSVRIKQVRSGIGHSWRMRATLEAIGLKHHQDVVVKPRFGKRRVIGIWPPSKCGLPPPGP